MAHSYGTLPSLIGKSTIDGPFSIATLNYQRVSLFDSGLNDGTRDFKWILP